MPRYNPELVCRKDHWIICATFTPGRKQPSAIPDVTIVSILALPRAETLQEELLLRLLGERLFGDSERAAVDELDKANWDIEVSCELKAICRY